MIRRAIVTLSLPDSGNRQFVQISYLGKTAKMEVIWPYGMGGKLPAGAMPYVFNIEGMEENKAGIGTSATLPFSADADGEVWIGNPTAGTLAFFKEDGDVEIGLNGATFRKLIDERFIALFNAHTHPDPVSGVSGTPTVPLTPGNQETTNLKAS